MGPYFKPKVSHQGPSWTPGTYARSWAKNDRTVPCQREFGVQTGLPCYPQYEVRPRWVIRWRSCSSKPVTWAGIAKEQLILLNTTISLVSKSLGCSCAHTAAYMPMGYTGILGLVGNACCVPPAERCSWGYSAPVVQSQQKRWWCCQWPSARASPLPGHRSEIRGRLLSLSSPAWYWARPWVLCVNKPRSYSVQMPAGIGVSVPKLFSSSWMKLWVTDQVLFR